MRDKNFSAGRIAKDHRGAKHLDEDITHNRVRLPVAWIARGQRGVRQTRDADPSQAVGASRCEACLVAQRCSQIRSFGVNGDGTEK
jgi:hypothetical protein